MISEEVDSAMKEKMSVKVDGCGMCGWIAPPKWRADVAFQIGVMNKRRKMAIQFDNGDQWRVELRGSGWSKDCKEGKSWRMKKVGGLTLLDVKKARDRKMGKKGKICENCGSEFA